MAGEDYEKAEKVLEVSLANQNASISRIGKDAADDLNTIVNNAEKGKAVLAVVITSLVKKVTTPSQDIRKHQAGMSGGYSGRGLDSKIITPFLNKNDFPYMSAGSGWLTRSLEQNNPYDLDYKGAIKPTELKTAFLQTLDRVETGKLDPKIALEYLFAGLVYLRSKTTSFKLAKPTGLSIDVIVSYLDKHFMYAYESGGSRLPVLAIYAAYTQMMKEVSRYKEFTLPDLFRHNASDAKTEAIGDIQVMDSGKHVVEAVEIKHKIAITPAMVEAAYKKFKIQPVKRYYLLTTDNGDQHTSEISTSIIDIQKKCGCQVIVNGVEPTLKYYLRLLENPDTFIVAYTELLEKDPDVKFEHKKVWNDIVSGA